MPRKKKPELPPKLKRGGQARPIPWAFIERMAAIQCTATEVIQVLGLAEATVYNACEREKGCSLGTYMDRYRSMGKMSLRRKQFKVAMDGNVTMLRWLGIQYLDQSPEVVMLHKTPSDAAPATTETKPEAPNGFELPPLLEDKPAETPPVTVETTGRTVED